MTGEPAGWIGIVASVFALGFALGIVAALIKEGSGPSGRL